MSFNTELREIRQYLNDLEITKNQNLVNLDIINKKDQMKNKLDTLVYAITPSKLQNININKHGECCVHDVDENGFKSKKYYKFKIVKIDLCINRILIEYVSFDYKNECPGKFPLILKPIIKYDKRNSNILFHSKYKFPQHCLDFDATLNKWRVYIPDGIALMKDTCDNLEFIF